MNIKKVLKTTLGVGAFIGLGVIALLSNNEDEKYSPNWFSKASDDELDAEREPIRIKARYNGGDPDAERLLERFDREMVRRMNEKYEREHPNAQPVHREHGWYLPSDD